MEPALERPMDVPIRDGGPGVLRCLNILSVVEAILDAGEDTMDGAGRLD